MPSAGRAPQRQILFIVASDPRLSARPAEAVRIAAGLAAGTRVRVVLFLDTCAAAALGEDGGEFMDGDYFRQYFPLLATTGEILQRGDGNATTPAAYPSMAWRAVTPEELAAIAAASHSVLRF